MHNVYLSLGSNIDRERRISAALDALEAKFSPIVVSPAYDCEPVGFVGDNFLNLVVGLQCQCSVAELMTVLRQIEDDNDRQRSGPKFSSRSLDIDILLFDDLIGNIDNVELPRGEITENAFVLLPLSDIAAHQLHPVLGKTYLQLWQAYDKSQQKLQAVDFDWQSKQ